MHRRTFIRNSSILSTGIISGLAQAQSFMKYKDAIIGHNSHQYKIDLDWGALNSEFYPVNDCHEMVQDSRGRILLLTNHTKNNVIVYNKSGKLLEVWGTDYPGAHGLTLNVENGEDVLYIADNNRHEVIKTTIDGKVMQIFQYPKESGKYKSKESYVPTETAIAPNGDVYIADGYGEQYIMHYNAKGELLNVFGGKGEEDHHFDNAHGISLDTRDTSNPTLLITARQQNKLKRFSLAGEYLDSIDLPGAYICRPVIHGSEVYLATIWSGDGSEGTGFISVLNAQNELISAPGGCTPVYQDGRLNPMYQTLKVFQHPHDVCVDEDENLYVAQWNSGKTYPIKLYRV
ncbi:6-bladed beta-propeller [Maribacter aestuarii]|uniref:6-bladed beta-propeller n=1 Tax=Maribacter aestuarii TaxID=1130723 RepID=UPI00248C210C|nr:6-bladed beta-propeller [Maribacter aestuarii]